MPILEIKKANFSLLIGSIFLLCVNVAHAEDYLLTLKDHQFTPSSLTVPVDQKVKLVIRNDSMMPAEFESSDLDREKSVGAGASITVFIGPLNAGNYIYFDDFHRETSGIIIAK